MWWPNKIPEARISASSQPEYRPPDFRDLIRQFGTRNDINRLMAIFVITGESIPGFSISESQVICDCYFVSACGALALVGDLWKDKFRPVK
jgi:hypothetical protein